MKKKRFYFQLMNLLAGESTNTECLCFLVRAFLHDNTTADMTGREDSKHTEREESCSLDIALVLE